MGWCTPTIPALSRRRQEHAKFKTNLSNTVRPHEKKKRKRKGGSREREAFLSTLRGSSKRLWSQASSVWPC